jgi:L-ascorbate metabolism protein UlaG (beta-lactamase superfamily)
MDTGFRLALLPIGAYLPHFFMSPVHMSPSEAYRVAHELHVQTMVPVHYGTFHLADDGQDQPVLDLKSAMTSDQKGHADVVILDNGEAAQIPIQVT